jgi:hypothetical protein
MLALASVGVLATSHAYNTPVVFARFKADGPSPSALASRDSPLVINPDRPALKPVRLGGRSYSKRAPEKESGTSGQQKPPPQRKISEEKAEEIKEEVVIIALVSP